MSENLKFNALLEQMRDLHERKNENYAVPSDPLFNLRGCEQIGISPFKGVVVRMGDKFNRICNLTRGVPDKVGESLKDTLMDMAVYSLLAILLLEEDKQ